MLADLLRVPRFARWRPAPLLQHTAELVGTVAIVTGGDSPLARAVALCMAHNGADVVLVYRHAHDGARETVRRMRDQGAGAVALCGELADPGFSRQVAAATLTRLDRVDTLLDSPGQVPHHPARAEPPASGTLSTFGDSLTAHLAACRVRVKAMTHGPIWSPLISSDSDTELPVNQHRGNCGPCFVFVARTD